MKIGENKRNKYKGFSLMEMVIAIFVFSLVMTTATAIFVKVASARKKTKMIQKNVEDARFAMEQISKTLRTSTVLSAEGVTRTAISAYDHSQSRCVQYRIFENKLQSRNGTALKDAAGKISSCNFNAFSYDDMTEGNLNDLRFSITQSTDTEIGKVTIMMRICSDNVCTGSSADEARIQTTVSLRDYWEVN